MLLFTMLENVISLGAAVILDYFSATKYLICLYHVYAYDARNRSETSDEDRIDQSRWSFDQIVQL